MNKMSNKMKICVLAGEKSGSNYGALLCKNLKKLKNDIFIFGTGGKEMEKEGVEIIKGMPLGVMGFSGVIKKIFPYFLFLKKVLKKINEEKPDVVIFIDNPGFNIRVAERLKRRFKTFYYIPPKVWAHRNCKRIKLIKKYIDFVIPIFPFEKEIYEKENIPYAYFGHPFVDLVKESRDNKWMGKKNKFLIGILPGSREEEIKYNIPLMKKVVENLHKKIDFSLLISSSEKKFEKFIENTFKNSTIDYFITDNLYMIIKNSDVILAVSGTVNLEVAYSEKPMIVFYRTSFLNYFIARFLIKLNMISPVNIILGEKIVPEYIQNFSVEDAVRDIIKLIRKESLYEKEMNGFGKLKEILREKNVSENIAKFIIEKGELIDKGIFKN